MPVQAKGQVRHLKSAYHSISLLAKFFEKDISLLLPRACSTMDRLWFAHSHNLSLFVII
jgi:hypothetical protein